MTELAELVGSSSSPALVVGAGMDTPEGWAAVINLAERLACPVWQDTFSSRAGFPQDHPQFAGHLPWRRRELRALFAGNDLVLALGTPAFRLYLYEPGPLVEPGTRVAVVGDDPDEVLRSPCDLAAARAAGRRLRRARRRGCQQRTATVQPIAAPAAPAAPAAASRCEPRTSSRPSPSACPRTRSSSRRRPPTRAEILARISIRAPLGFVAVANGALGFGLAGAVGLRMARPDRPVLALLGDGSSMYSIQALWSAAHYGVGVVFVVMSNGRYAVMDHLADAHGAPGAWPSFHSLDIATVATGLGCPARQVATHDELLATLDEAMVDLAARDHPLVIEARIE